MEQLFPKTEYEELLEKIDGKSPEYCRRKCSEYFDTLVTRLHKHVSCKEWGNARKVAEMVCEARIKSIFTDCDRTDLFHTISDVAASVADNMDKGFSSNSSGAYVLEFLLTYDEWDAVANSLRSSDSETIRKIADKYRELANGGTTLL